MRLILVALIFGSVLFNAVPSFACRGQRSVDISEVQYADAVAVGRIKNYEIVLDQTARKLRDTLVESDRQMSSESRRLLQKNNRFPTDYALFVLEVDRVLKGTVLPETYVVFHSPRITSPGAVNGVPVLIALGKASPNNSPRHGPATEIQRDQAKETFVVIESSCSGPLIFNPSDEVVSSVRKVLKGEVLAEQPKGPLFPEWNAAVYQSEETALQQSESNWELKAIAVITFLILALLGAKVVTARLRKN
jgi:hypothetical protein